MRSSLTVAGLVAAYGFDEGTGTGTADDTENAHDAALTGQTWVAGKYGTALEFDGSYLTVAPSNLLELDSAMTLSAWVMPTGVSPDWQTVIRKDDGASVEYVLYADGNPSAPYAVVTPAGGTYEQAVGNQGLPRDEWSHLTTTFDGNNLTLYLNGEPTSTVPVTGPLATSPGPLVIGGNAVWGEYFEGLIDEVRVYDRALSLAEIKTDIHTPINPTGPDTTPPSVMLTAPAQASAVAGVVQLEAAASDDISVTNVKFFVDGNLLSEDDWPPYTAEWNSLPETPGTHTLTAQAFDVAGNVGTSSAVSVTVLEGALVAAYSFDEGSGTELHDITGNGNDAAVSGPTWAAGKYGSALSFDGDYITIPDAPLLDLTTGVTLSAWVQPLASHVNWPNILLKEKPGGLSYALHSEWTGASPSLCIGALEADDDCVLGGAAPTETWTHLAGTFDGFESKIYVNGQLAGSVIQTIPAGVSDEPLRIGGNAVWGNEYFVGLIDEVRVYARSLSQAEIQADMNTPMGCGAGIDDNNPCTADSCDPVFGITHTPLPAGTSCSDANLCNGTELCDGSGVCQAGTPFDPDDGNPCTTDSCDPVQGVVNTPVSDGTACDDSDACTQTDTCQAGTCTGSSSVTCSAQDECHAAGTCDPATGACSNPALTDGTSCDDSDACTQTDTCQSGSCTGSNPITCSAQDQCHAAGTCDPGTGNCSNPVLADGTACSDGDACTSGDACSSGACAGGNPVDPDDGNPCTADSCDASGGVTHTPVAAGTSCADADVCNGAEVCDSSGVCQPGTPIAVDDGNVCTTDACDPIAGVSHTPVAAGTACDDGNVCNGSEACDAGGTCQAGTPLACDDANACNGVETCLAESGCAAGAAPPVDDGNPCTADSCDAQAGVQHDQLVAGASCSDGDVCNGSESCDGSGVCQAGIDLAVDDGNPCTTDACDPLDGVSHLPVAPGGACDLDACTMGGTCDASGTCVGGTPVVPDDGDPCTVETCDPLTGVHSSVCTEDTTVATTVVGSMQFLYTGLNPAQQGVNPEEIAIERAAVIAGSVTDRGGAAIPGVRVSVLGHDEFGYTNTQADGTFVMVINGGGEFVVDFQNNRYLRVQRQVTVGWGDSATVPNVALIESDTSVTTVDLTDASEPFQVHQSNVVTDTDGSRQGTLLFPAGTQATMELADGTQTAIDTLNVRITEFTVGDMGPSSMPAALPATSAYTYAFEVNADEAVAAGARSVEFDQPLFYYVDNFLGFPAGTNVPVGSYDRDIASWVREENGIVLEVTDIVGGIANLDIDGDNIADDDPVLAGFGIDVDERAQLAALYGPGQSLWRVPLRHFTQPWDCNWGRWPPDDAEPPPPPPDPDPDPPEKCEGEGSIIECETQVLRESVPVAGTPFSLNYTSARVPGRMDRRTLSFPLTGSTLPFSLVAMKVDWRVAGRIYTQQLPPAPDVEFSFIFDGKDRFGRDVQGRQRISWSASFSYGAGYRETPFFGDIATGVEISGDRARDEIYLSRSSARYIGFWDARLLGLGGWTLNVHHGYEPGPAVLQLGDGREVSSLPKQKVVRSWPQLGIGSSQWNVNPPEGDGGHVDDGYLFNPQSPAVAPDGTIYFTDGINNNVIRRITPDGIITRFAGLGYTEAYGYNGDGLPAVDTQFGHIIDLEVGPDGSVYVLEEAAFLSGYTWVRRIGPDGIVTRYAGTATPGYSGDGGPATEAQLNRAQGIGLGRLGDLYIADTNNSRVRKVSPDGTITTIGGNGMCPRSTNGCTTWAQSPTAPAKGVGDSIRPTDVAEHPDGSVYAVDGLGVRVVRRYDLSGNVTTVAGVPCTSSSTSSCTSGGTQPGVDALTSNLSAMLIRDIAFAPDGSYYLAGFNRIVEVDNFGLLSDAALGVRGNNFGDAKPATELAADAFHGVEVGPNGVYFTSRYHVSGSSYANYIYKTALPLPGLGGSAKYLTSRDGDEVYVFDWQGRHVQTRRRTGELLYSFSYGSDGLLTSLVDSIGKTTTIERGVDGTPLRIVGPYGQVTELDLDSNGYLQSITNPLGASASMTYSTDGLLESFTDPRGNTTDMTYDEMGRLVGETDAFGATQLLTRVDNVSGRTVTKESGQGVTFSYATELLSDGVFRRTNTFPDNTQAISEYGTNSSRTTWLANGTIVSETARPDPRFGLQNPIVTVSTTLPSGLQRTVTRRRTVALVDENDLFSVRDEGSTTSVNGNDWIETYDGDTRMTEYESPEGRWTQVFTDAQGNVVRVEEEDTLPIEFFYDTEGRLELTVQGDRATINGYFNTSDDRNGYLETMTDALGNLTRFERDALGRILNETAPDSSVIGFSWDEDSNLIGATPPGRPQHSQAFNEINRQAEYRPPAVAGIAAPETTFAFNLDRQPTFSYLPDGRSLERVYDGAGKLDLINTPEGSIDYNYFAVSDSTPGRLASIVHPSGVSVAYTYDGALLSSATWSGAVNGAVSWTHNNDFRVATEAVTTSSGNSIITMGYDDDDLLVCASPTTCPSGSGALRISYDRDIPRPESSTTGAIATAYAYNAYGELASYEAFANGTPFFSEVLDTPSAPRDNLGRIVERTETNGSALATYSYQYDLQGRLTEVSKDGSLMQSFTYDDNGNRLSMDTPAESFSATYDDQDRLLTYGRYQYTYTDNGELLSKSDTSTADITLYEYDVFGNLVRVDLPDGTTVEYLIDGRNRRVGKLINGTLVKQWVWVDQHRIAAELDGTGNLVSRFVYGNTLTTPELVIQGTTVYRVISDHLGSVRAVVNTGDPTDVPVRLDYDAFGSVSGTGGGFLPQGFAGGLYDVDTGLVRLGARDLDPVAGRWVSKEPLLLRGDSLNLYGYAFGDPVNYVDGNGQFAIAAGIAFVGLTAASAVWLHFYLKANEDALEDLVCPFTRDKGFDDADDDDKEEKCRQEWAWANQECGRLLTSKRTRQNKRLRGGHNNLRDCAKGYVSVGCGGNRLD